jgi:hypothetical protein
LFFLFFLFAGVIGPRLAVSFFYANASPSSVVNAYISSLPYSIWLLTNLISALMIDVAFTSPIFLSVFAL